MQTNHLSDQFGERNVPLLDALSDAYRCAASLASWGFEVSAIIAKTRNPVIWLRCTWHCQELQSAVCKIGFDARGKYQIRAAHLNGCEINWEVRA